MNIQNRKDYGLGLQRGLPIAFGYLPVSFTFGLTAVSGGLPVWLAIVISLTNLTSAGQFAGTNLMIAGKGYLEITLVTFVINIRYMLMSLSISQKIESKTTLLQRLIFAFGITDETFSVASMEEGRLSYRYMLGLITGPIIGWTLGTALGGFICSSLPENLSKAMGIALYGMFIAIIIPPARKSKKVVIVLLISITITCILRYVPGLSEISAGFRIIIATVISAGISAYIFPLEEGGAK